jgi:hypothetical protein
MGLSAAIVGGIGGLCAIWGIIVAMDVISNDTILVTVGWMFWLVLSAVLLLASTALLHGRSAKVD